jgi:hypothetical protein
MVIPPAKAQPLTVTDYISRALRCTKRVQTRPPQHARARVRAHTHRVMSGNDIKMFLLHKIWCDKRCSDRNADFHKRWRERVYQNTCEINCNTPTSYKIHSVSNFAPIWIKVKFQGCCVIKINDMNMFLGESTFILIMIDFKIFIFTIFRQQRNMYGVRNQEH